MVKFFVNGQETAGPEDWQYGLADPKHWKTSYSAKALAYSWETAKGFPPEVKRVFEASGIEQLCGVVFLEGFVENETSLPGGNTGSHSDILVFAESERERITIAVEGKVEEPFDKPVAEWLGNNPSPGKRMRLRFLKRKLGISGLDNRELRPIRYQLLHRTAAAVIEAERFNARYAVMLVHSFSQEDEHFEDYREFLDLFGIAGDDVSPNSVTPVGNVGGIDLFLAWVRGNAKFLKV